MFCNSKLALSTVGQWVEAARSGIVVLLEIIHPPASEEQTTANEAATLLLRVESLDFIARFNLVAIFLLFSLPLDPSRSRVVRNFQNYISVSCAHSLPPTVHYFGGLFF